VFSRPKGKKRRTLKEERPERREERIPSWWGEEEKPTACTAAGKEGKGESATEPNAARKKKRAGLCIMVTLAIAPRF